MASNPDESRTSTCATPEVNVTSPWQAFQVYLMEKIASVRLLTGANYRPTRQLSQQSTDEETQEYERELAEFTYLYGSQTACVFLLPQEILLKVFSLLSCRDLCVCAQVCRLWRRVSEDPLMWSARLVEDSQRWPVISSHTFIDKELKAKAPAKLAYLRCSPKFGASSSPALTRRPATSYSSVSNLWRSWFPKKNSRFLLCEGDARLKFMRRILHDKFDAFVPVSMFSTEWFLNSGLTYQMKVNGRDFLFDLVTFAGGQQVDQQLFEVVPAQPQADNSPPEAEEEAEEGLEALREDPNEPKLRLGDDFAKYTRSIDGLIFIVNAECSPEEFKKRRREYRAFIDNLADKPNTPILFLSLVLEDEMTRNFSCVEMARFFNLISLPNPWIICDGRSKGLHKVADGFHWLVQRAAA